MRAAMHLQHLSGWSASSTHNVQWWPDVTFAFDQAVMQLVHLQRTARLPISSRQASSIFWQAGKRHIILQVKAHRGRQVHLERLVTAGANMAGS